MSSSLLQSLVTVHSAEPARRLSTETTAPLTEPSQAALHKTHSAPSGPASKGIELQPLPKHAAQGESASPAEAQNGDLEMSRPGTPDAPADAASVVPTIWEPYMNRFRLLMACVTALAEGMGDSAAGALIPYMEKYATPPSLVTHTT